MPKRNEALFYTDPRVGGADDDGNTPAKLYIPRRTGIPGPSLRSASETVPRPHHPSKTESKLTLSQVELLETIQNITKGAYNLSEGRRYTIEELAELFDIRTTFLGLLETEIKSGRLKANFIPTDDETGGYTYISSRTLSLQRLQNEENLLLSNVKKTQVLRLNGENETDFQNRQIKQKLLDLFSGRVKKGGIFLTKENLNIFFAIQLTNL